MVFPNDVNGDVLKRMYDSGMDLSMPYNIDFYHFFEKKRNAILMYSYIKKNSMNIQVEISENEGKQGWDVCCTLKLLPTHQNITNTELFYDELAKKFNGYGDGWGVLQE